MLRAFLRSITGKSLLVLALSLLLWHSWLSWAAEGKVDSQVYEALQRRRRVDLLVELNFPPERFHVLTFQKFGRVSGTRENTVELRGVARESVPKVARFYWVRQVSVLGAR